MSKRDKKDLRINNFLNSIDVKVDPYFGVKMYRIFKLISFLYLYIVTTVLVLLVGAFALEDKFVDTNQWVWICSIFIPYIVILGILCSFWWYFSKWADVVKEESKNLNNEK